MTAQLTPESLNLAQTYAARFSIPAGEIQGLAEILQARGEAPVRAAFDAGFTRLADIARIAEPAAHPHGGVDALRQALEIWKAKKELLLQKHPADKVEQLFWDFLPWATYGCRKFGKPNVEKAFEGNLFGVDLLYGALAASLFGNPVVGVARASFDFPKPGEPGKKIFLKLEGEALVFGTWLFARQPAAFAPVISRVIRHFEGRELSVICAFAVGFSLNETLAALDKFFGGKGGLRHQFLAALRKKVQSKMGIEDTLNKLLGELNNLRHQFELTRVVPRAEAEAKAADHPAQKPPEPKPEAAKTNGGAAAPAESSVEEFATDVKLAAVVESIRTGNDEEVSKKHNIPLDRMREWKNQFLMGGRTRLSRRSASQIHQEKLNQLEEKIRKLEMLVRRQHQEIEQLKGRSSPG